MSLRIICQKYQGLVPVVRDEEWALRDVLTIHDAPSSHITVAQTQALVTENTRGWPETLTPGTYRYRLVDERGVVLLTTNNFEVEKI